MYKNYKIAVVIPCYNEEKGLKKIKGLVPEFVDEIIIIDNASSDETAKVAGSFATKVLREEKKGYGYAYQKGLANIPADTDIIATCDGDATYPIEDLAEILDLLIEQGYDFISGSRFPLEDSRSMRTLNKIGNLGLNLLFFLATGRWLQDSQSGMWVFRKDVLSQMYLRSGGMPFSEEIKMEALLNKNINFSEYHINYHKRMGEVKLAMFRDGIANVLFLFKKRKEIISRNLNKDVPKNE